MESLSGDCIAEFGVTLDLGGIAMVDCCVAAGATEEDGDVFVVIVFSGGFASETSGRKEKMQIDVSDLLFGVIVTLICQDILFI